ncbi:MAG: anaerobic ribonucleoside-triphosphate reductase [Brevinematales bacterium]|nr:anaerobic ribonucleoside-triphosphate reductase [Brevinematales bacterium]
MQNENKKLVMPTEVYSRVVGYYRPVQNWNVGKRQEFSERLTYDKALSNVVRDSENHLR